MYVHYESRNSPYRDGVAIGVAAQWAEGSVKSEAPVSKTFGDRLIEASRANDSLLCVGLDPVRAWFPSPLDAEPDVTRAIVSFNAGVIAATSDLVCAYKAEPGLLSRLQCGRRCRAGRDPAPHSRAYSRHPRCQGRRYWQHRRGVCHRLLRHLGFRRRHGQPLSGRRLAGALPALTATGACSSSARRATPARLICRTSRCTRTMANSRSTSRSRTALPTGRSAGQRRLVSSWARRTPTELAEVRRRCPNAPILLPGIGAQAGDLEASLHAGLDSRGLGLIVPPPGQSSMPTMATRSTGPRPCVPLPSTFASLSTASGLPKFDGKRPAAALRALSKQQPSLHHHIYGESAVTDGVKEDDHRVARVAHDQPGPHAWCTTWLSIGNGWVDGGFAPDRPARQLSQLSHGGV